MEILSHSHFLSPVTLLSSRDHVWVLIPLKICKSGNFPFSLFVSKSQVYFPVHNSHYIIKNSQLFIQQPILLCDLSCPPCISIGILVDQLQMASTIYICNTSVILSYFNWRTLILHYYQCHFEELPAFQSAFLL